MNMKRSQARTVHYARNATGTGWATSGTDISDFIDYQSSQSLEVSADTFQLTLKNTDDLPSPISPDDRLDFFAANSENAVKIGDTSTDYDNYFLFNGTVEEVKTDINRSGDRRIVIQGASASQVMLRVLLPMGQYKTDNVSVNNVSLSPTPPNVIRSLLEFLNQNNPTGRQIVWNANNPLVKNDGSAFPSVSISSNYRPLYQIIADLSTDAMTADGDYYFYVKVSNTGTNDLIWRKKQLTTLATPNLVEGTDFSVVSIPYGAWDLTNHAIVHCGQDAENHGILTHWYGSQKQGLISAGTRSKYIPTSLAGQLLATESTKSGSVFVFSGRYPSSYPFWSNWQPKATDAVDLKEPNLFSGNKFYNHLNFVDSAGQDFRVVANNNADFNYFLRKAARLNGKRLAKSVVETYGYAKWKMVCKLYSGSVGFTLGGLYRPTVYTYGWQLSGTTETRKYLRLVDVKHTIGRDGWNTSLEFEQDALAIKQEVG